MSDAPGYDVAIIGAGINGAGIARDAALRGLKVLILDKNDACSGTSAVSSRLIHGGLRYLEYGEVSLVYESLRERRILQQIAPHLVTPIRITIPIYEGARRGAWLIRLGMIAYDLLSFRKRIPGHARLSRDELLETAGGIRRDGLKSAVSYYDAQITFTERLVVENLLAAIAAGADVKTYAEVTAIESRDDSVHELHYRAHDGARHSASVSAVINAAGPWVDSVLKKASAPARRFIGGTKGSHIVVGAFDGAPQDAFYVEAAADGRPIFIIPWNDLYLIGTTDIRYDGSLDTIRASREEVDYLMSETNRVFPRAHLDTSKIHYAYAGVRPLPFREAGPESAITRKHIILSNEGVAKGLLSIIGGKITTYRNLAEQSVDQLTKVLRRKLPICRTREMLLPGATGIDVARQRLAELQSLSGKAVQRLLNLYGGRAAEIAAIASQDVALEESMADGRGVIAAEIVFVIREEFPRTLADIVFRRTMLGLEADQGRPLYAPIAACAANEFDWDADESARQFAALNTYADSLLVVANDNL